MASLDWSSRSMAAVSSSLMSRSALAARARVYAAEAMRRACSGGIDSSLATMRRTVAVSPAGSGTVGAGRSTTVVSGESDFGLKKRSNIEAPLPAFKGGVVGSDGDECAAARGGDDATGRQFGVDDDAVAVHLDRPRPQMHGLVGRRRASQADRVVGGHAAGRTVEAALAHQVHRRRPVGVAVQQGTDDAAV